MVQEHALISAGLTGSPDAQIQRKRDTGLSALRVRLRWHRFTEAGLVPDSPCCRRATRRPETSASSFCGDLSFHAFPHDLFPAEIRDIVPDILSFLFRNPRKLLMDRNHSRCVVIGDVVWAEDHFRRAGLFHGLCCMPNAGP